MAQSILVYRIRQWYGGLRLRKAKPDPRPVMEMAQAPDSVQALPPAAICRVDGVDLVFGLDWSPIKSPESQEADLQAARGNGYNYGALMPNASLVGLARRFEGGKPKKKMYSAVLVILDRLAASELEAYILKLGERVCFVGLVDRQPVPGFDQLLSDLPEAVAVLTEFRGMHVGQDIRICTNLDEADLPNGEKIQLDALLSGLDSGMLVRRLINRPLRRIVGTALFVAVAGAAGIGWWLYDQAEQQRAREEAERQARESDPNYIYEQAIGGLLGKIDPAGNTVLDRWREIVLALPLVHHGWTLTKVECQAIGCKALWQRDFGNFRDFDQSLPPGAKAAPEIGAVGKDDLLKLQLETLHPAQLEVKAVVDAAMPDTGPVPASNAAAGSVAARPGGLDRARLPLQRDATTQWGSVLHDWSLIDAKVQLGVSALFGPSGQTNVAAIAKPVVRFAWQIADGAWSLPAVRLPQTAIPETLLVTFQGQGVTYQLTGSLYAKGKKF
jgi:hypothetical protein